MASIITCSAGHTLQSWVAKAGVCDGCSAHVRSGDRVMGCRSCDYYLCESCAPQGPAQQPSLWDAFSTLINMEMEVTCKAPTRNEQNDEEIVIEREPTFRCATASAVTRDGGARAYRGTESGVRGQQGGDPLDELVEQRVPFTRASAAATEEPKEKKELEQKKEPEVKAAAPAPMVDLLDLDAPVEVLTAPAGNKGSLMDELDFSAPAPVEPAAPKHLEGPAKIQAARLGA